MLRKGIIILTSGVLLSLGVSKAQDINPVRVTVPSMSISPDARSTGMGNIGVATTSDSYSQFWNPAKYSYLDSRYGVALSYAPWLSGITSDIGLMSIYGYYKVSEDASQYIAASIRYFKMGEVIDFSDMGKSIGDVYPHEYSIDVSYSRQLTSHFSMAVALRGLFSDLGNNDKGYAFAADVAGFYKNKFYLSDNEIDYTFGFNIKNIGTKMSYSNNAYKGFIPTNLGLGAGVEIPLTVLANHKLGFNIEINKLLVPTPPIWDMNKSDDENRSSYDKYQSQSSIGGIFNSLYHAPGGFGEKMREIGYSLGCEYSYDNNFFARMGYTYQHPTKGNIQGVCFGAGFKMKQFNIDASYFVSTVQHNPLNNTLKLSLTLDIANIIGD